MTALLLDHAAPTADADLAVSVVVDAPPAGAYAAAIHTDLAEMPSHDPLLKVLYAIRALPERIAARVRRDRASGPMTAAEPSRLADMPVEDAEWVRLAERPGEELVGGAIARLGGAETRWRRTGAREYGTFSEPGWVKLLLSINVRPYGEHRSLLTYETRAVATDDGARRSFLRYWRLFRPGIRIVMSRSLKAIKREAERAAGGRRAR